MPICAPVSSKAATLFVAHRVLRIVLAPLVVGYLPQRLECILIVRRVAPLHQQARDPFRLADADLGGLQDGAERAFRRDRVLLDKVPVPERDAAEVLGPGPVHHGDDNVSDLLRSEFLSFRRNGHEGIDLSVRQEPYRFGIRLRDPGDVLARVKTHVG